jgi:hypothetical protein
MVPYWPSAAFYLLPTRAWELAIGAVGALALIGPMTQRLCSHLFFPVIAALLFVHISPFGGSHPGLDALVACGATLIVIISKSAHLEHTLVARALAKVGDFSYSLYLVHWPIFAFLSSAWIGKIPAPVRFGATIASLLLGYMLYRCVEKPIRRMEFASQPKLVVAGLAAATMLVLAPLASFTTRQSEASFSFIMRSNYGLGPACDFGSHFSPAPECSNGSEPRVLVWGDSFAMHLVPGLIKANMPLVQATKSGCGPLLGMAAESAYSTYYNRHWAEQCNAFNRSVLQFIGRSPEAQVIVLASSFRQYLAPNAKRIFVSAAEGSAEREASIELAVAGLRGTIEAVRALGKRVVIVGPPPIGGFDVGRCLERLATGKILLGSTADCKIPRVQHERLDKGMIALLRRVAEEADVKVIWFDEYLCDSVVCNTYIQKTLLYRDIGHLSHQGSELLAIMTGLPDLLERTAR